MPNVGAILLFGVILAFSHSCAKNHAERFSRSRTLGVFVVSVSVIFVVHAQKYKVFSFKEIVAFLFSDGQSNTFRSNTPGLCCSAW